MPLAARRVMKRVISLIDLILSDEPRLLGGAVAHVNHRWLLRSWLGGAGGETNGDEGGGESENGVFHVCSGFAGGYRVLMNPNGRLLTRGHFSD